LAQHRKDLRASQPPLCAIGINLEPALHRCFRHDVSHSRRQLFESFNEGREIRDSFEEAAAIHRLQGLEDLLVPGEAARLFAKRNQALSRTAVAVGLRGACGEWGTA